jgi:hypothetical protein
LRTALYPKGRTPQAGSGVSLTVGNGWEGDFRPRPVPSIRQ